MKTVNLIFPHQLFKNSPLIDNEADCYFIEVDLFFTQFKFHKQKIAFHRASMKAYAEQVKNQVRSVTYIDAHDDQAHIEALIQHLKSLEVEKIITFECSDNWLEKQLTQACQNNSIKLNLLPSRLFLSKMSNIESFFKKEKNNFFHHQFYMQQRKRMNIMVDEDLKPEGGQWSFDENNRKKYPKDRIPPSIEMPQYTDFHYASIEYVKDKFSNHLGEIGSSKQQTKITYPITHQQAENWLDDFLKHRFQHFGTYEDAIVKEQLILHHSVLTPLLNVGLLSPQLVVERALKYAAHHDIPLNSLEGFIRQIIGWREFIRGLYETVGTQQRTRNFWQFNRPLPKSFYTGETGITPVDETIKKVLKTGYCHHIERLMILGNFMLLCEFDPDAVYQWFMELFIDAYDWVMVPNVYGMSQFADGGLMATKPYISSSNYVLKMSDYPGGKQTEHWRTTWDGLFWRFMHKQRHFFEANPRIGMLLKTWNKMDSIKQDKHLQAAKEFLSSL